MQNHGHIHKNNLIYLLGVVLLVFERFPTFLKPVINPGSTPIFAFFKGRFGPSGAVGAIARRRRARQLASFAGTH